MIKGIGVDIVETDRFAQHTVSFAHLILSDAEFDEFYNSQKPTEYLATRFAAKEAAIKAVGRKVPFLAIQVVNDRYGKPQLRFLANHVFNQASLSISHDKGFVVAMVVLE